MAARRSGSSVRGPASATRQASAGLIPPAISRAVATSSRRAGHLGEPAIAQSADANRQLHERRAVASSTRPSCTTISRSTSGGGKSKLQRHEALPRARLQVLERRAGSRDCRRRRAGSLARPRRARRSSRSAACRRSIAERMDDNDHVLPRLDHLVQIADRADARGAGEGPSCHTVSPPRTSQRPVRSLAERSSWQATVTSGRRGATPCARRSGSCRNRSGP